MAGLVRVGDIALDDIGDYLDVRRKIKLRRRCRQKEAESRARVAIALRITRCALESAVCHLCTQRADECGTTTPS